jgi:hypothetical protein
MTWLTGWSYRKSHVINSANNAGTNYTVKIKVSNFTYIEEPTNPILVPGAGDIMYSPTIVIDGSTWWMWYGGADEAGHYDWIYVAQSTNGVSWTKGTNGTALYVLQPSASGWDSAHVNDPTVVKVGSTYYMYYTGCPAAGQDRIGLATATSPYQQPWTKEATNPVLDYGYNANEYYVGRPTVLYEDGIFKMWYDGQTSANVSTGIYYATSTDGKTWTRYGKVIDGSYASPTVWRDSANKLRMIVNSTETTSPRKLYLFEGTNETTWTLKKTDLIPASSAAWHTTSVDTAFLMKHPTSGKYWVYFAGGNATFGHWRIGLAYENVDSGENVALGNNVRTDFGDVRFTSSDGTTLLDYWMESETDNDNAVFWVEVSDNLSAGNVTIYIYYGNATATTTSNGANTFLFFDDFSGDLSKWTVESGTWSIVSGELQHTGAGADRTIHANATLPNDYAVHWKAKFTSTAWINVLAMGARWTGTWGATGFSTYYADMRPGDPETTTFKKWSLAKRVVTTDTALAVSTYSYSANVYYKGELRVYGTNQYALINGGTPLSATDTTITSGTIGLRANIQSGQYGYYDDIFVRKYVSPEPAHGSWGTEETAPAQVSRTITEYLANLDIKGRVASLYRSKIDYVGLLDTKVRLSNIFRVFAEQLGLFDTKMKGLLKIINEQLGLLDKKIKMLSKVMKDYIGLSDIKSRVASLYRMFIEYIGLTDKKFKTLSRMFSEVLGLIDSVIHQAIFVIYRTIVEYVGLLESKYKTLSKITTEKIALSDVKSRIASLHRIFIDYVGLLDIKRKSLNKTIIQYVALLESKMKTLSKTIKDYIGLLDASLHNKVLIITRTVMEYLGVKDAYSRIISLLKYIKWRYFQHPKQHVEVES